MNCSLVWCEVFLYMHLYTCLLKALGKVLWLLLSSRRSCLSATPIDMSFRALILLSIVFVAHAGISDTVNSVCSLFDQMGSNQQDLTPEKMQSLFGEFASLFAETVDCSEDPYNPVFGFDLKSVPFMQCAAAKQKRLAANPQAQLQLSEATCIQKIIDEKEKSAAVWVQFGNTGKLHKGQFQMRGALRYSFNDDGKITAYHFVYDTYNLLGLHTTSLMANEGFSLGTLTTFAFALFGAGTLAAAFVKRRTDKAYSLLENEA
jgi:hypothetical protein